ncbi:MAG: glycosyltransferase family 4 protein [Methylomonas sp.]|nr:glycosyltransferase family 4 protein [Methylomonas sp.]
MRVLVLSRYSRLGASSRLRFYQYLPFLESAGLQVTVKPLLADDYLTRLYAGRRKSFLDIAKAYFKRLSLLLQAKNYDLIWLEKECFPWLPAWIELGLLSRKTRLVVDYDDAIFHQYDRHSSVFVRFLLGKKIECVMHRAELVIAGNDYLAERARQANARRVAILPTVVDTSRYQVVKHADQDSVTIGWIGSPATARYLRLLGLAFGTLLANKKIRVLAVGANPAQLVDLPITVLPWTEEQEVAQIQQFDIGIMPLLDEAFERGKCGYKLIQYMACGIPVVASPVGANKQIVRDGIDGFLADSDQDWTRALMRLSNDPALRLRMGEAGRRRAETLYSLQRAEVELADLLRSTMDLTD